MKWYFPRSNFLPTPLSSIGKCCTLHQAWGTIGYYAMQIAPAPPADAAKKLNAVLDMMAQAFLSSGKYVGGQLTFWNDFYSIV